MCSCICSLGPNNASILQVLGVDKQASQDAIKAAFRKKALRLHPDKNPSPEAAEEFKVIAAAYGNLVAAACSTLIALRTYSVLTAADPRYPQ